MSLRVLAFAAVLSVVVSPALSVIMTMPRQNNCEMLTELVDYIRTRDDTEEIPRDFCQRMYDYHAEYDEHGDVKHYIKGKAPILQQMEALGKVGAAPPLSSMRLLSDAINTSRAIVSQCTSWIDGHREGIEKWRLRREHLSTLKPYLCDRIFNLGCTDIRDRTDL